MAVRVLFQWRYDGDEVATRGYGGHNGHDSLNIGSFLQSRLALAIVNSMRRVYLRLRLQSCTALEIAG